MILVEPRTDQVAFGMGDEHVAAGVRHQDASGEKAEKPKRRKRQHRQQRHRSGEVEEATLHAGGGRVDGADALVHNRLTESSTMSGDLSHQQAAHSLVSEFPNRNLDS
jgi:hypothetical protein